MGTAELIRNAGPWGQGVPEPVFDGVFEVLGQRVLADRHLKLVVSAPGLRQTIDAIAFNVSAELLQQPLRHVRLVYRLDINEFRGQRQLQLMIDYFEPASAVNFYHNKA